MRKLAALLLLVIAGSGCKVHPHGAPPGQVSHPKGGPPGQVKKMYRCGSCGITKGGPGSCHGAALILVP